MKGEAGVAQGGEDSPGVRDVALAEKAVHAPKPGEEGAVKVLAGLGNLPAERGAIKVELFCGGALRRIDIGCFGLFRGACAIGYGAGSGGEGAAAGATAGGVGVDELEAPREQLGGVVERHSV